MRRAVVLGLALWVVSVTVVAAVAWAAITSAGRQVTSAATAAPGVPGPSVPPASSSSPASSPPASSPPATPSSSPSPSSRPEPSAADAGSATRRTEGGTVTLRCAGPAPRLSSAPRPGWVAAQENEDGRVEVTFAAGGREIEVRGSCEAGRAVLEVEEKRED